MRRWGDRRAQRWSDRHFSRKKIACVGGPIDTCSGGPKDAWFWGFSLSRAGARVGAFYAVSVV